jgi:hypothetical protein
MADPGISPNRGETPSVEDLAVEARKFPRYVLA